MFVAVAMAIAQWWWGGCGGAVTEEGEEIAPRDGGGGPGCVPLSGDEAIPPLARPDRRDVTLVGPPLVSGRVLGCLGVAAPAGHAPCFGVLWLDLDFSDFRF